MDIYFNCIKINSWAIGVKIHLKTEKKEKEQLIS